MIVVAHQTAGVELDTVDLGDLGEKLVKGVPLCLRVEDPAAPGASIHQVLPGPFVFDP